MFRYQMDLIIYLIDTVFGSAISEQNVKLMRDNTYLTAVKKDMGFYALYNTGRENFELTVCAEGYENKKFQVNYENLDSKIPAVYIQMVPKRSIKNTAGILELTGNIPGLEAIDAVCPEDSFLYFKEYRKEERVLTLYDCREEAFTGRQYAVVDPEKTEYAVFEIRQELSDSSISGRQWKINGIPERFCVSNTVIARVIQGITEENGDYVLRLKAGTEKNIYMIRCIANGTETFGRLNGQDEDQKTGGILWERW